MYDRSCCPSSYLFAKVVVAGRPVPPRGVVVPPVPRRGRGGSGGGRVERGDSVRAQYDWSDNCSNHADPHEPHRGRASRRHEGRGDQKSGKDNGDAAGPGPDEVVVECRI